MKSLDPHHRETIAACSCVSLCCMQLSMDQSSRSVLCGDGIGSSLTPAMTSTCSDTIYVQNSTGMTVACFFPTPPPLSRPPYPSLVVMAISPGYRQTSTETGMDLFCLQSSSFLEINPMAYVCFFFLYTRK